MNEQVDTIIVGGGQGGLSTSYFLTQHCKEHVILEQTHQAAKAWRERWDSFTFITPNWMIQLPGAEYQGSEPDSFMSRDEIIAYFENYTKEFELPIKYGIQVTSIQPNGDGFLVKTNKSDFIANNVVIATGMYQHPKIPKFSNSLSSEILQLHSMEYRNPEGLPAGSVLVVGSAQSGCQIAEELYQTGRKVFLTVGNSGRFPRRYRKKEITHWLDKLGFYDLTPDKLPSPKAKFSGSVHGTGKDGGHTINLHQFARDGVILLGHIQNAQDSLITLAQDLKDNLTKADKFEAELVKQIDEYFNKNDLVLPPETLPELRDGYEVEEIIELDLNEVGISSIIWATGYKFDFRLVKIPIFDEDGYPVQKRGVTKHPGLYFIGLPFLHTAKSGLLFGVGDDAAHVAEHISSRIPQAN
jgi:putative flavoprotein involved in K+ transport